MSRTSSSRTVQAPLLSHLILLGSTLLAIGLSSCYRDTPPSPPDEVSARLVRLASDGHPDVRRTAAESLGKIALPSAETPLAHLLNDVSPEVRAAAAEALGRVGTAVATETVLAVAAKLEDEDPRVRSAAARTFAHWEPAPSVTSRLASLLRSVNLDTRRQAVQALLLLDAPAARQALIKALEDTDPAVRQGAVAALGESADPSVIPFLTSAITEDPANGVRAEAAYRLGKIGNAAAKEKLIAVAMMDADPRVRRWARAAADELTSTPGFGSTH